MGTFHIKIFISSFSWKKPDHVAKVGWNSVTEHDLSRLPVAATRMLSARRQGRGISNLSHFFLHQLAPLASITCLVLLVSEFGSLDLMMSSISSWPHHPTVSASHLASTHLDPVLTISPVLDGLPCPHYISNFPPVASKTQHESLQEAKKYVVSALFCFAGSSNSFPPRTTGTLSVNHSSFSFLYQNTDPVHSHGANILPTSLPSTSPSLPCYSKPPWWSRHHPKCITLRTELVLLPHKPAPLPTPLLLRKVSPLPQAWTWNNLHFLFLIYPLYNQLRNLMNSSSEVPLIQFLSIFATTPLE